MTDNASSLDRLRAKKNRLLCFLIYLGSLFNGPLYIPVVSLALLTEGRTARDLPKQRWSKKNV